MIMVIYNLFTSVVVLTAFALSWAVQTPVVSFSEPLAVQIASSDSVKTISKCLCGEFESSSNPMLPLHICTLSEIVILLPSTPGICLSVGEPH